MAIIKVKRVTLNNFKNVGNGTIKTNVTFDNLTEGNVIGVYGQNGSGKTALVEAFKILNNLLRKQALPTEDQYLIMDDKETVSLDFEFLLVNQFGEFELNYKVELGYNEKALTSDGKKLLTPLKEELWYRENAYRKKPKRLVLNDIDENFIRNTHFKDLDENKRVDLRVLQSLTSTNAHSFILDRGAAKLFDEYFNEIEKEIYKNLVFDFSRDLHVIDSVHNGLVLGNLIMPLSINIANQRGKIPYSLTEVSVMPVEAFEAVRTTIEQINVVLKTVIPGLEIEPRKLHSETTESGDEGVRVEFLTHKTKTPLPIRCESAGALKIISILSTLISVYNNPNACVVIDELDSGVFEFLLGEMLEVISDNGRGQLFFTSHNLRVLEVLNHKNLWFTTSNQENRYIQLVGVKSLSNARDIYLRAVQLGGQNEEVYQKTKAFKMKKAFRMAGDRDVRS